MSVRKTSHFWTHSNNIGMRLIRKKLIFLVKTQVTLLKRLSMFSRRRKNKGTLELGAGQGRDALFFAKNGLQVYATDCSEIAVEAIRQKAQSPGLSKSVTAIYHDVRSPLPFEDSFFDVCCCRMLYCMALCTSELESLFQEVKRVLKPKGLNIYTVRHMGDTHFAARAYCVEAHQLWHTQL